MTRIATTAGPQLSNIDVANAELTSSAAVAQHVADGCLVDGPVGRVGLEIEAHCFDPADPVRRPSWDEISDVLKWLRPLPGGSAITVEPGGAIELSGPPAENVVSAIDAMNRDQAVLRAALADAGLGLVFLGADPLRSPQRINPGARYRAMEQFFAASDSGAAGAAMMTSTASIQVNLDAGPQAGWAARVRLAHALGPTMIAIAANSPMLAGEFSGWQSTRQWVWGQMDSARCGPILGVSGEEPGTDWARYALKAPVMMVHAPDAVPVTHHVPFTDWVDGRVLLGDRRPTIADLEYHLTTLFPPVRPRQWLEIRYLDSVPDAIWPALVFTLTTLLDDPAAADLAAAAVEQVATAWDTAARVGLRDRRLYAAANRCLSIAAERAPAELAERFRDAAVDAQRRDRAMSGRRLLRPRHRAWNRRHGRAGCAFGTRGAVRAREQLACDLERARSRTLRLVDFDDDELRRQYDPLMSPLVWDLAHIGQQEELWLLRGGNTDRPGMLPPEIEGLYDAFVHSRASRVGLPLLSPAEARSFCRTVRDAALDALDALAEDAADFQFGLVVSHENQHGETMLQALNLRTGAPLLREPSAVPAGRPGVAATSVLVPGGPFVLGVDAATEPYSLDNERPAHTVEVPSFRIGRVPVTNAQWQRLHRRRRLCGAAVVVEPRLAASTAGRPHRAPVLERRHPLPDSATSRTFPPTSRCSMSRISRPRHTRRGRVPGCPPRSSGRRPAPGIRRPSPVGVIRGATNPLPRIAPTWVAPRYDPRPSARTRAAHRHTGPSRCSATSGNGPVRRCAPGPDSCR